MLNISKILKAILYTIALVLMSVTVLYQVYPKPYEDWVISQSQLYDIDPLLIFAMMKVESGFEEDALSRSGAKGLMQIMDRTGKWGAEQCGIKDYATSDLFEPKTNIQIGVWYISRLVKQYHGNLDTALAAYNAGSGNVAKWRGNKDYSRDGTNIHTIPFKETARYVKKVNFHYRVYQWLYTY